VVVVAVVEVVAGREEDIIEVFADFVVFVCC
jgi:hypothetical protein